MTDADDRMSKHTRGPWRIGERGMIVAPWSELVPVKMDDGEIRRHPTGLLALVYSCTDPGEPYRGPEANAHLVAAAPELLEALRRLLADSEHFTRQRCANAGEEYGLGTDAEQAARIAIAKAEWRERQS